LRDAEQKGTTAYETAAAIRQNLAVGYASVRAATSSAIGLRMLESLKDRTDKLNIQKAILQALRAAQPKDILIEQWLNEIDAATTWNQNQKIDASAWLADMAAAETATTASYQRIETAMNAVKRADTLTRLSSDLASVSAQQAIAAAEILVMDAQLTAMRAYLADGKFPGDDVIKQNIAKAMDMRVRAEELMRVITVRKNMLDISNQVSREKMLVADVNHRIDQCHCQDDRY
jgi:hypothetical protein